MSRTILTFMAVIAVAAAVVFASGHGSDVEQKAQAEVMTLKGREEARIKAAEADQAQLNVEVARTNQLFTALVQGVWSVTLAVGTLLGVLVLGLSLLAYVQRRMALVYPNQAGQYPLILFKTLWGDRVVHNANLSLSPMTAYRLPSLWRILLGRVTLLDDVAAHHPLPADAATMNSLAQSAHRQASVVAATRIVGRLPAPNLKLVDALTAMPIKTSETETVTIMQHNSEKFADLISAE